MIGQMVNQMSNQAQQVDPLTGMPTQSTIPVQPQAQLAPPPSNTLGTALPVINEKTALAGEQMFGNVQQRQNSVDDQFIKANTQTV